VGHGRHLAPVSLHYIPSGTAWAWSLWSAIRRMRSSSRMPAGSVGATFSRPCKCPAKTHVERPLTPPKTSPAAWRCLRTLSPHAGSRVDFRQSQFFDFCDRIGSWLTSPAWCGHWSSHGEPARATAVASGWCTPLALQKRVTYNRPCGTMDAQEEGGRYRCRSIQITSLW
jgi:hypothetical protein